MVEVDEMQGVACARRENGQKQMTGEVEMPISLFSSLSCRKFLLETHAKVTCIKYRHWDIICPVEELCYAG